MRTHWVSIWRSEPEFPTHWVDHHVLNLKMLRKFLPLKLPKEFVNLSEGETWENPKKPPLCETAMTRWRMEGGASRGSQIEEKELKVTLLGTWESNGTPLTVNFPSHKSKTFSSDLNPKVEFTGLFGGAMEKWATRRNKNKKKMIQNYIDDKRQEISLALKREENYQL